MALAVAAWAGVASADPIDDLLSGKADPVAYDYGALRDRPDADAWLETAETRVQRAILRAQDVPDDVSWTAAQFSRCLNATELAMLKGVTSARKATTADDWRAARREAETLAAKRRSLEQALFAGEPAPYKELRNIERRLKRAGEAADPVTGELLRRAARDNFERLMLGVFGKPFWATDASAAALDLYDVGAMQSLCATDLDNRGWLKAVVAQRGWFLISRDGAPADAAAWLIVQHADRDIPFQQSILAVLEKAVLTQDTDPSGYAYLYDRVAGNTGKPQRYGTQGYCAGPGDWRPDVIEDPDGVDARRTAMGIAWPLKDYIASMNSQCP